MAETKANKKPEELKLRLTPDEREQFREDAYRSRLGNQGLLYQAWLEWRSRHLLANQSSRPSGGSTYKRETLVTEQEANRYSTSLPGGLRDLLGETLKASIEGFEKHLDSLRRLAMVVQELEQQASAADTGDDEFIREIEETLGTITALRKRADEMLPPTPESESGAKAS